MSDPQTRRVADLIGSRVIDADGATLGRVVDLAATTGDGHRLLALEIGVSAWLDRLNLSTLTKRHRFPSSRRRIAWAQIDRIDGFRIHLKPGATLDNPDEG
jgi:sporulation protein YlmC with PRC-barrel domain